MMQVQCKTAGGLVHRSKVLVQEKEMADMVALDVGVVYISG